MTDINVTMSDQIIQVLDALCEKFGVAVEWGQNNVIPYVQVLLEKYIRYNNASHIITFGLMAIASLILLKVAKFFRKKEIETSNYKNWATSEGFRAGKICSYVVFGLVCAVTFFYFCYALISITKCIVIPELWLLETFQKIMG